MELNKAFSDKAKEDILLVNRAKEGDEKAFAELMKRYRKAVYHMILKMVRNADDSEDLMVEAFAKAFKNLQKFTPDYTFGTWLFRIATNNSIDFLRKKRLHTLSLNVDIESEDGSTVNVEINAGTLNPQEQIIKSQKAELMRHFVSQLPPKYRRLVSLRYFEELSYEEIAEETQKPLGTVKAQLFRARELLFDMLKNKRGSM